MSNQPDQARAAGHAVAETCWPGAIRAAACTLFNRQNGKPGVESGGNAADNRPPGTPARPLAGRMTNPCGRQGMAGGET